MSQMCSQSKNSQVVVDLERGRECVSRDARVREEGSEDVSVLRRARGVLRSFEVMLHGTVMGVPRSLGRRPRLGMASSRGPVQEVCETR